VVNVADVNGTAQDTASPTVMVMQYLRSKGLPLTPQNISRALQMNSENPGMIPGLTNQAPPPADPARVARPKAPATAQRLPVPPIPPQTQEASQPQASGAPPQAAASPPVPQPVSGDGSDWLVKLLGILIGGGAGIAGGLAGRGGSGVEPMGNQPLPNTGRMMDVPDPAITGGGQPQIGETRQLAGPSAPMPQGQPQVGGPGNSPQLQAPAERPPIRMPNEASGPTIPMRDGSVGIPGARAFNPNGVPFSQHEDYTNGNASDLATKQPVKIGGDAQVKGSAANSSGIDWAKVLGEIEPLVRRMRP